MTTLILIIHLTLAAGYLIAVGILLVGALTRRAMPTVLTTVISSFGGIIVSGVGLVALSPKAITQFCVSAFVSSICGAVVAVLYRRRVTTVQAL